MKPGDIVLCIYDFSLARFRPSCPKLGKTYVVRGLGPCNCGSFLHLEGVGPSNLNAAGELMSVGCGTCLTAPEVTEAGWWKKRFIKIADDDIDVGIETVHGDLRGNIIQALKGISLE